MSPAISYISFFFFCFVLAKPIVPRSRVGIQIVSGARKMAIVTV